MNKINRIVGVLLLSLFVSLNATTVVHATETTNQTTETTDTSTTDTNASETGYVLDRHDAVADIMTDERFVGAIDSISWLTERIDKYFTMVITATAFFIISSALLKNVCAGAYCANHKFWDKVAQAHEKSDALTIASVGSYFQGKQFMNTSASSFKDMILGIIPNIKALTDFDDADIEPKAYFMKAIPQMLACIIIGVFVYNGYYRDTAATVGTFGSVICERVFSSVDPAVFVDKLTDTTATPPNIYKNDPSTQGNYCYQISMALYKACISSFSDIKTSEDKTALMRNCEAAAYNFTNSYFTSNSAGVNFFDDTDNKDYKMSGLKVQLTPLSGGQSVGFTNSEQFVVDKNGDYYFGYINSLASANITPPSGLTSANQYYTINATLKVGAATGSKGSSSTEAAIADMQSSNLQATVSYKVNATVKDGKIDLGATGASQAVDVTSVASQISSAATAAVKGGLKDNTATVGAPKISTKNAPSFKNGDAIGSTLKWNETVKVPVTNSDGSTTTVQVTIYFKLVQ